MVGWLLSLALANWQTGKLANQWRRQENENPALDQSGRRNDELDEKISNTSMRETNNI